MTLIDKAEAHEDDLIRREDVLKTVDEELRRYGFLAPEGRRYDMQQAIAALPARGVGVDVEEVARAIYDAMRFERKDKTPEWVKGGNSDAQVEARSTAARILAALAPTDAAHVNETPKSEHDGADVLMDAAQAREAALREAAAVCDEICHVDDTPEYQQGCFDCADAILALISEART